MLVGSKNYKYLVFIILFFSCNSKNDNKFLGSEKINEKNYLDLYRHESWGVGGDVYAIYLRNSKLKNKKLLYKYYDHQGIDHKLIENKLVVYKINTDLSKVEDSLKVVLE